MDESKLQKYTQSAISIAQEATGPNLGYFLVIGFTLLFTYSCVTDKLGQWLGVHVYIYMHRSIGWLLKTLFFQWN